MRKLQRLTEIQLLVLSSSIDSKFKRGSYALLIAQNILKVSPCFELKQVIRLLDGIISKDVLNDIFKQLKIRGYIFPKTPGHYIITSKGNAHINEVKQHLKKIKSQLLQNNSTLYK